MSLWICLVIALVVTVVGYLSYVIAYGIAFKKAVRDYRAQFTDGSKGEKLVIRTDGLFPVLGEKPPESAMWRVKTGMYFTDGGLVVTYRYDPNQLENADLDLPENIEAEIREMEAEGRAIMDAKKLE